MKSTVRMESKIVLIFILCTILIASVGCFALPEIKPAEETTVPVIDVELTVKCEQNLIFARYDVAIQVDGQKIGTVEHGTTKTYSLRLEEGPHLIKVFRLESSAVSRCVFSPQHLQSSQKPAAQAPVSPDQQWLYKYGSPAPTAAAAPAPTPLASAPAAHMEPKLMDDGSWICSCGRVNQRYVTTCACGQNKREVFAKSANKG